MEFDLILDPRSSINGFKSQAKEGKRTEGIRPKKIDVSGYPTDPKFLLPTLKILS
jgi:hypothetical protein